MTAWNQMTNQEQALVRETFKAQSLMDGFEADTSQVVSFSDLYAYAADRPVQNLETLTQALRKDAMTRQALQRLLSKTARYGLPRAAAAATGPIRLREIEDCRIQMRASRAEPNQVYVIIDLPQGATPLPTALFIYHADNGCTKHPLPPSQDSRIQILTTANSELVQGLSDHRTEIFLR
jgi:hypothetical protein